MMIRPVQRHDVDAVLRIAKAAGIGMTSLPADPQVLHNKVERAARTFEGSLTDRKEALYFFVLEDPETREIVGTCGIEACIGLKRPMYSYKIITVTQYSDSLDIFTQNQMLQMVNDYTGVSEIGSLFLMPEYRRDRLGRLLSRVRFLFMGLFRQHFADCVIAEIRGWHDSKGHSPFYNSLAKKFFQMEFSEADWLCATKGNRFISELMPAYPVYVSLLPDEARDMIGRPNVSSEPAKAMLEKEGFHFNNYIDIFDGGPTLEAKTDNIKTIRDSKTAIISAVECHHYDTIRKMIALPAFADFRACLGFIREDADGTIVIDEDSASLLNVSAGDTVTYTGA